VDQGTWDYLVGGVRVGNHSPTQPARLRPHRVSAAHSRRRVVHRSLHHLPGAEATDPAILAPIGSLQVFHPEAGAASTRAATDFGILHAISSVTQPALEETAAATATPKNLPALCAWGQKWTEDIIGRVKEAGYAALALTVDVAHYSRRERPMLTRYQPPTRRLPPTVRIRPR